MSEEQKTANEVISEFFANNTILKGIKVFATEEDFAAAKKAGQLDPNRLHVVKNARNRGFFYYSANLDAKDITITSAANLDGTPIVNDMILSQNGNLYVCTSAGENAWTFSYKTSLRGIDGTNGVDGKSILYLSITWPTINGSPQQDLSLPFSLFSATPQVGDLVMCFDGTLTEVIGVADVVACHYLTNIKGVAGADGKSILYLSINWQKDATDGSLVDSGSINVGWFSSTPKEGDLGISSDGILFEITEISSGVAVCHYITTLKSADDKSYGVENLTVNYLPYWTGATFANTKVKKTEYGISVTGKAGDTTLESLFNYNAFLNNLYLADGTLYYSNKVSPYEISTWRNDGLISILMYDRVSVKSPTSGTELFNGKISRTVGASTYDINIPSKSGTMALTSDIPSLTGYAKRNELSNYVTQLLLSTTLSSYAKFSDVTASLASYLTASNTRQEIKNNFSVRYFDLDDSTLVKLPANTMFIITENSDYQASAIGQVDTGGAISETELLPNERTTTLGGYYDKKTTFFLITNGENSPYTNRTDMRCVVRITIDGLNTKLKFFWVMEQYDGTVLGCCMKNSGTHRECIQIGNKAI